MLKTLAANGLVQSSLINALIKQLLANRALSPEQGREVYDDALRMVEESQGRASVSQEIFELARKILEQSLPKPTP